MSRVGLSPEAEVNLIKKVLGMYVDLKEAVINAIYNTFRTIEGVDHEVVVAEDKCGDAVHLDVYIVFRCRYARLTWLDRRVVALRLEYHYVPDDASPRYVEKWIEFKVFGKKGMLSRMKIETRIDEDDVKSDVMLEECGECLWGHYPNEDLVSKTMKELKELLRERKNGNGGAL